MKTLSRALLGTVAAGMMAASVSAPALAQDYGRNDRWDSRSDRWDNRDGRRWDRDHSRGAVAQCTRVVEREAMRRGYDRADVTQIRSVRDTRDGFVIKGRMVVSDDGRWQRQPSWRGNDRWDRDYRDDGQFTCRVERGRVVGIDYSGIRGL